MPKASQEAVDRMAKDTGKNHIPVGCFAPQLTDEKLAEYKALIDKCPSIEVKDALSNLLSCVTKWWELPESTNNEAKKWEINHRGQKVVYSERPLDEEIAKELWDVTPWMRDLDTLSNSIGTGLFDSLNGPIRDCAFHLLWFAKELTLDREPMTVDKLGD